MGFKLLFSRFLKWFCDPSLYQELSGDLEESYHINLKRYGKVRAELIYSSEVVTMLRPSIVRMFGMSSHNYLFMGQSTRVALRAIRREKLYSLINIIGLSTSMAICLLIILFYVDQRSMDKHSQHYHSTYRVLTKQKSENGRDLYLATSPYDITDRLRSNFEGIEATSKLVRYNGQVKNKDHIFGFDGFFVEQNFLNFFAFELKAGNPNSALNGRNSVIISSELALKLFPNSDPIGQFVVIPEIGTMVVNGVFAPFEKRSHISLDLAISFKSFSNEVSDNDLEKWVESGKTYFNYYRSKTDDQTNINSYLSNLSNLFSEHSDEAKSLVIQPLEEVNFGYVVRNEPGYATAFVIPWFLGVLAAVLMLSACFNYIGLSIAQSLKRAREINIRKIIGATKKNLVLQFLIEAQVVVFVSWLLALVLLYLLIPFFNELTILRDIDGKIRFNIWSDFSLYGIFLSLSVLIGIISGGYPAWYIGKLAFNKVQKKGRKPGFWIRKSLIFVQYFTSIILIITALVLDKQAHHFLNMDYQFETDQLLSIGLYSSDKYDELRATLLDQSHIESVSLSGELPALTTMPELMISLKEENEFKPVRSFSVNEDFLKNFGIELKQGENFRNSKKNQGFVLVNERFCHDFNLDPYLACTSQSPITIENDSMKYKILGVVQDFKYQILLKDSGPLVLTYVPEHMKYLNVKYHGWTEKQAAAEIENVWRTFDRDNMFNYQHYNFQLNNFYGEFIDLADIVSLVALLGIILACVGQFGMILHYVSIKTKEVGIRKVLGSSISQLVIILSKSHLSLMLLAITFGSPIAFWINNRWTQKIGYPVEINSVILVQGLFIVLFLSGLAIFILTTRAALANPVDTLKEE